MHDVMCKWMRQASSHGVAFLDTTLFESNAAYREIR